MQNNQGGEFTTIGFLFLALLPTVFLFLPFRRKYYYFGIILLLIIEIIFYIKPNNNLIPKEELVNLPKSSISEFFDNNHYIFTDNIFSEDIYDINFSDYINERIIQKDIEKDEMMIMSIINDSKKDIARYVKNNNLKNDVLNESKKAKLFESFYKLNIEKKIKERYLYLQSQFYDEIKNKTINISADNKISVINKKLQDRDIKKLYSLRDSYHNFFIFVGDFSIIEINSENQNISSLRYKYRTTNQLLVDTFTNISLPYGYLLILLLALVPLIFFIPTLQKKELTKLFKINLIFTIFYSFLWGISAFGIVWYGIVMYFNFILMIIFGGYYIGGFKSDDKKSEIELKFFGSVVFFSIICIYLFLSVFPHSFNNLKSAGYKDYKTGDTTVAEAPYLFHPEYLAILYNLNIGPEKTDLFIEDSIISVQIKNIIKSNKLGNNITGVKGVLSQILQDKRLDTVLKKSAQDSLQNIYKNISKPKSEYKNMGGIYRIGTFLKYHISENNKRLLEDSLLTKFSKYIYDEDVNKGVDRMNKLGVKYLLVDLNAATIDKDPRHELTARYEKLLTMFTSTKLELIETDSMCLKVGLEEYKKNKNIETYLELAGVNYDGYTTDNQMIKRSLKQVACYERVISLIKSKKVTQDSYSYLNIYIPHLAKLKTKQEKIMFLHKYVGHGFKVLFKMK